MRYGGHETFRVREGWLYKGLEHAINTPHVFLDKVELANALGVGVNMAKSIEHWLLATKLVTKNPLQLAREKEKKYEITELGSVIHTYDPFMIEEETWWLLHINIVNNPEYAATWDWFFNEYAEMKFDKTILIQKLMHREKTLSKKAPSRNTIERDVSCFLSTYAKSIPRDIKDPEDDYGSPFQELQLMSHQKNSGTYEVLRRPRKIRPEVFMYAINQATGDEMGKQDFSLTWLNKQRSGPLNTLCITSEGLFELAIMSEEQIGNNYEYTVRSLAGDRQLVYFNPGTSTLLSNMYKELK